MGSRYQRSHNPPHPSLSLSAGIFLCAHCLSAPLKERCSNDISSLDFDRQLQEGEALVGRKQYAQVGSCAVATLCSSREKHLLISISETMATCVKKPWWLLLLLAP